MLQGRALLPIRDATHMFNAPAVDPLSPGLREALSVSGTEYRILLNRLQTDRKVNARTVVLALPGRQMVGGLADRSKPAPPTASGVGWLRGMDLNR